MKGAKMKLTKQDLDAILNAICFTLAGEWDQSSHNVTKEQMEVAEAKIRELRNRSITVPRKRNR